MGWWGFGIMEGDSPLDMEAIIFDTLKIDQYDQAQQDKIGPALTEQQEKIFHMIKNHKKIMAETKCIGHQVLAYLMMKHGSTMKPEVKELLIKSIQKDDWAKGDDKRKKKISKLLTAVVGYENTQIELPQKGLFEVLGEHLKSGKSGLINVIPKTN